MRLTLTLCALVCIAGCGDDTSTPTTTGDMSAASSMDLSMSAAGDMAAVAPYNMPGKVYCYQGLTCSTTSTSPVCCDQRTDGGFSDSCVADPSGCPGGNTFACGQAADCPSGQICCGTTGMSKSGKLFLNGTNCATSCTASQTQLCVTASECKSGTMCAGQAISGRDVGLCK